jgi:putative FmdB family regulatory protein
MTPFEEEPMPIYEYQCDDCGREFEALVRTGTVPECPDCQSTALHKHLSVTAPPAVQAQPMAAGPCGNFCANANGPGGCGMRN